jgi:O-antigen ligase
VYTMKWSKNILNIELLKERTLFILLMVTTIGFKEFFRHGENEVEIALTSMSLSLVCIPIVLFHMMQNGGRISVTLSIALTLFIWLIASAYSTPEKFHYGLEKAHLGLILPLTLGLLACRYKYWAEDRVLGHAITFALIVLILGLLYKVSNGFFDRQVRYGLLGPIPFGWVCGMGALAGFIRSHRGLLSIVLSMAFVLAVLWSGSKGPAFALVIIAVLKFRSLVGSTMKERLIVAAMVIVGVMVVKGSSDSLRAGTALQAMLTNSDEYVEGEGAGSVGARLEFYSLSKDMFVDNSFFGVGFGAWTLYAKGLHRYPHNLFLEIGSETGLIGLVLLLALLWSLKRNSKVTFLGYFFILCLLFSGDFSYFRYALFLLLIGTGIRELRPTSSTPPEELSLGKAS